MAELPTFTEGEVAAHKTAQDLWIIVLGKVYNVTEYLRDHPGGPDVLKDVAGQDATAAYEDVGHSEDADEILSQYLIGHSAEGNSFKPPAAVKLVQQPLSSVPKKQPQPSTLRSTAIICTLSPLLIGASAYAYGVPKRGSLAAPFLEALSLPKLPYMSTVDNQHGHPFVLGFAAAGSLSAIVASIIGNKLLKFTQIESGFEKYPLRRKQHRNVARPNPHMVTGFLNPKEYKGLTVARIDQLSPNVYLYVFNLPDKHLVLGLPVGQHVAVKAIVNGQCVTRSYTPTSNNLDTGVLELVIKVYPDGVLTGNLFANLKIGDQVQFRGPKGPMRYQAGLCNKIGMIAGGTGITPMYQLIRAICEDERDTTEISLIFANRSEEDILLRSELEGFAARYPRNFKLWFMLDKPPESWDYGKGYLTREVMSERLPSAAPDSKIMLCGPPGLVAASKRALVSLGFQEPGAVAKMTDQIFLF
ncbi:unnamed protein product [Clonostachys chloroleuca]|uniref:Cytochrome b5 reductase n=1 Tax=Clonostachys chloroleuca TaxID=1926264 RepID=A0AA35PVL4_9HYPO|nr:unnamed protein product [Clonostachys chloroleuca]